MPVSAASYSTSEKGRLLIVIHPFREENEDEYPYLSQ